ncbi:MAG: tetratricopeptide repeat protein, partial [bacterium]
GDTETAYTTLDSALDSVPDTASWVPDARITMAKLSLNLNNHERAKSVLKKMEESPTRVLLKTELYRRLGQPTTASKMLETFRSTYNPNKHRSTYVPIALAVYRETDNHEGIVKLLDEVPDNPQHQLARFQALLALDRPSDATRLYHRLDLKVVPEASRRLGDYFYQQGNWKKAVGYYREAPETNRVQFRIGRAYKKQGKTKKAYTTWTKMLSSLRA